VPIAKTRYPFSTKMIAGAPKDMGVYALWRDQRLLYVGRALGGSSTIFSRLEEHMSGALCDCSRQATHYSWEIVTQPIVRELELLQEQRNAAGQLPPCNLHSERTA
jgi:hypothetical protein